MSVHLPPLPPVGGETTGPDVADVVDREHRELLALCDELLPGGTEARDGEARGTEARGTEARGTEARGTEARGTETRDGDARGTGAGRSRTIAQVVSAALSRHLSAEEQYVYPAVRAIVPGGEQLADREIAEDRALLEALRLLEAAGDDERAERAADVRRRLQRHADAAAGELMPLLVHMASAEELIRLGNRVEMAEEAAPTRPHPGTPATPPWNKVVDPAVAVVDKIRDVVGRRITYPRDL